MLSIIIPVYKVEKYLRKCLDSCFYNQTSFSEYEVIAINDGSPDNCDKILKEYSLIFPNFKVITQENKGLSIARNNGLREAKGDYIWFVDSDDYISSGAIEAILKLTINKPDLIQLNYQKVFENTSKTIPVIFTPRSNSPRRGKDLLLNIELPAAAQFTVYNRDFLLKYNLRFEAGILHEDSEFKPRVTYLAKSVVWCNIIAYNYLIRESGSIMSSFKLKNAIDMIQVNSNLLDFKKNYISEFKCKIGFNRIIALNINTILKGIRNLKSEEQKQVIVNMRKNNRIFRYMVFSYKLKYIIEGLSLLFVPKITIKLYNSIK